MSFAKGIIMRCEEQRDSTAAKKMSAYVKGKFPFYGLTSSQLKQLCKEVYSEEGIPENGLEIAKYLFSQPKRELHYIGQELLLKTKKQWQEHYIEDVEWFITNNSWWDTVDFLASNVVGEYFKKWPEGKREIIMKWNSSDNMWLVRASIIFQLKYKDHVDTALLSDCILPHVAGKEFFIRKAIGWALRQYSRFDKQWVEDFMAKTELQPLSKKEALRLVIG
ncbi:DNA alkylation repair protein [Bacteroidia bacterium]|nr:DNA alkylation repair protein [Bacteroidia bacterium]MDB4107400.1 DNA alkylation repair protein [Bacteroidia bacterium]MDB9883190.1 DNA alkylation repair protein [Bacteroidia bacterium]